MKSDRSAALLLMGAAMIGVLVANSPFGASLIEIKHLVVNLGLFEIDLEHIVSEMLLAVFFLVAGLELKYELRLGTLANARVAMVPIVAAISGVLVPAGIYLLFNPIGPEAEGWPIPTATDIAFALGMLAIIGRGLPAAARVFLLALAIFDDVIAILIIAFKYTEDLIPSWLLVALAATVALRLIHPRVSPNLQILLTVVVFSVSWFAMYTSGVHATIAGVLTGLAIPATAAHGLAKKIQPITNGLILPLFAFVAVSIQLPESFGEGSSVFLGIATALPLGKLLGIALVGYLMNRLAPVEARLDLRILDFAVVAGLAGIGFTVSLLLAKLSFEASAALQPEAIFGVLIGSILSMILAMAFAWARNRVYGRRGELAL